MPETLRKAVFTTENPVKARWVKYIQTEKRRKSRGEFCTLSVIRENNDNGYQICMGLDGAFKMAASKLPRNKRREALDCYRKLARPFS